MKTATFFAIRHKSTGLFMPETRGRGSTSWEPVLGKSPHSAGKLLVPRLFSRKMDAVNSIRWWAEGEWVNDREDGMPMRLTVWNPKHKTPVLRKQQDLEILEIELKIVGQMEMAI